MPTTDKTPFEKELRKAMQAIDAIRNADDPVEVRVNAIKRIRAFASEAIALDGIWSDQWARNTEQRLKIYERDATDDHAE